MSARHLVDLIGRYLKLERDGREFLGLCPFHKERTPSFRVYSDHYHCFGCGAHGGAAKFLQRTEGITPNEARRRLGACLPKRVDPELPRHTTAYAAQLAAEARQIAGGLGERYIREVRNLGDALPIPPEAMFHPAVWCKEARAKFPALLLACRDTDGRVARIQAVLLDPRTGTKAKVSKPKLVYGRSASHIPASFAARVDCDWIVLCEGPEDAIVTNAVTGLRCDAALGSRSLGKPEYPAGSKLIVFGDNTEEGRDAALSAAAAQRERGCTVALAFAPDDIKDANDLLRARGATALREVIQDTLIAAQGYAPCDAPRSLPSATPAMVHAEVLHEIETFLARCDDPAAIPPRVLLKSDTGSGKTRITLHQLKLWIDRRKQQRRPHRTVFMVPAHKLGSQILEDARAARINAAVFEGRDRKCKNTEAVELARQAAADVYQTVCGSGREGAKQCPFRTWCSEGGYLANLHLAGKADLIVCANNFTFEELPEPLRKDVGAVVIDEDFAALADRIFRLGLGVLDANVIHKFPVLEHGKPDTSATVDLQAFLHTPLINATQACLGGYLTADALRAAGFTATTDAARMREQNWRRKVDVDMQPDMPLDERREVARKAAVNAQLPSIAALTHAVEAILAEGDKAAGLVSVDLETTRTNSQIRLIVRGQRRPARWLSDIPVLMLNASGRIDDVRRVFPSAEVAEVPQAIWPHCAVHQIIGGFGRSTLARNKRRIEELRDFVTVSMMGKQQGMLAVHMAHEEAFTGIDGVLTEHHGNLAGSNDHELAHIGFVIGGAFPSSNDVASIAAARGGGAVKATAPRPVKRSALVASGSGTQFPCLSYEDTASDAVHRGVYDTSIIQAVGRMRPMRRTESNPAIAYVFGNVALPFPVASIQHWREIRPTKLVRMIARKRVWLNATHMALFERDLFISQKAAERARDRFAGSVAEMREGARKIVRNDFRPWVELMFQAGGQGQREASLLIPANEVATARQAIEAELGELRVCRIESFTPGKAVPDPGKGAFIFDVGTTYPPAAGPDADALWLGGAEATLPEEHPPDG
jgi:DNA primase